MHPDHVSTEPPESLAIPARLVATVGSVREDTGGFRPFRFPGCEAWWAALLAHRIRPYHVCVDDVFVLIKADADNGIRTDDQIA